MRKPISAAQDRAMQQQAAKVAEAFIDKMQADEVPAQVAIFAASVALAALVGLFIQPERRRAFAADLAARLPGMAEDMAMFHARVKAGLHPWDDGEQDRE